MAARQASQGTQGIRMLRPVHPEGDGICLFQQRQGFPRLHLQPCAGEKTQRRDGILVFLPKGFLLQRPGLFRHFQGSPVFAGGLQRARP